MKEFTNEDIERVERLIDENDRTSCIAEIEGMHPLSLIHI